MTYCKISLKKEQKNAKHPGYRDDAFRSLFGSTKVKPELPFSRSEFKQDSVKYIKGMSISGVQQKLLLKIDDNYELIPVSEGGVYILKPSPEEFPNAAENEHAAMITSSLLKIDTAPCGLVSFTEGDLAYITKRFDRLENGEKQHQEDLVQGFGMDSSRKYDESYEACGKLIDKMTNGKKAVVLDFVRRVIHAYLIGNDDMHLKNISLQRGHENASRYYDKLTPNYDSLFTEAFENINSEGYLALDLLESGFSENYEHYGYYTGYDFIELGIRLNIPERLIKKIIGDMANKKEPMKEVVKNSYMPDEMKKRAMNLIDDRSRVLFIGTGAPLGLQRKRAYDFS
jgi:serine/threonine-protein kinase HipA